MNLALVSVHEAGGQAGRAKGSIVRSFLCSSHALELCQALNGGS